MRDDKIRVVQIDIERGLGKNGARESAGDSIAVLDRWAPDSTDH